MFCSNCGKQISNEQAFCPSCGAKIECNVNNTTGTVNTVDSLNNNINKPSDSIGFKRNNEQDLNGFSFNDPYQTIRQQQMNVSSQHSNVNNIPPGMNMTINHKKKFPWIPIAIGLIIIMVVGLVFLPSINSMLYKTYESDHYSLKYNYNWSLDEEQEDLFLYYSDKFSKLVYNASTKFSDFSYKIVDEESRKGLYKIFYDVWGETENIEIGDGTNTFLDLENGSIYARIDYKMTTDKEKSNKGAFYVVVNEDYDSVISFMSYCTESNWDDVNEDIVDMLGSMTYKGDNKEEKLKKEYSKFEAGATKKYSTAGYMDYYIPESFIYDNEKSLNNKYKSNIFAFKDGYSVIDIKASTIYDASANISGTNYEKMKLSIEKAHGTLEKEDAKVVNGVTWYHMVTKDYVSNGSEFHNEIYFALSASGKHLYYLEIYIYNEDINVKQKYLDDCIDYILNSITLYKNNE